MPNDTHTTTGAGSKAQDTTAKEAWNKAAPFPITEDIRKLKVAVAAACDHKTQGEAALIYAKLGIPVFPCNWKTNSEGIIKKRPVKELGEGGLYLATTDPEQIQKWWKQWPEALIGVPMGRRVGMWGVDADSKEKKGDVDGVEAWFDLVAEHDPGSAVTRAHKTGTEGLHFLYLWDDNRVVGCPTMKGIGEVKGEGGYLIFPPSPYTLNGKILRYRVSQDIEPEPAPDWLYDLIIGSRPKSNGPWTGGSYDWSEDWVKRKLDEVCEQVRSAKKGHWDEVRRTKVLVFGRYVGGGAYDVEAAWKELEKAAKQCDAPDDYVGEVKRAFFNGVKQPLNPPKEARAGRALPASQWLGERPIATPPALIKGVLPQTGVAIIGGQSGAGKTFHALHLVVRLVAGCEHNSYIDKYPIKRKGGVLYFVLEGKPAFPLRVKAAFEDAFDKQIKFGEQMKFGDQMKFHDRAKPPFAWNTFEPNLFEEGPDDLIKLVERDAKKMRQDFGVDLVTVGVDTMGLAACYENEDKASQVQKVISGLNKLSDATGALVIGVDHYGKHQDAGLRGSSAKRGHVETILACLCENGEDNTSKNLRLKFEKIRDGAEGRIIPYRLKSVNMGVDEDGDQVSTCIIQWEPQRPMPKKKGRGRPKTTDATLERAIEAVGGLPADADALQEAFYKFHGGKTHAANAAWHRALKTVGLSFVGGKYDYCY